MTDGHAPTEWRTPFVVLVCGMLILLVAIGVRNVFGLLVTPISTDLGWGREVFSLAVAIQTLLWGIGTPFAGALADRYGSARIVALGGAMYAGGLVIMSTATTPVVATLGIGVLTGFAMSAAGMPIVLAVISRTVSAEKRSLYLGIASAGGSSGQFLIVPGGHFVLEAYGWVVALIVLAAIVGLIVPLSAALVERRPARSRDSRTRQSLGEAVAEASTNRGFLLLASGYFVCGFQTMFISTHLPGLLTDAGFSTALGAWAISIVGFFNIIGCFLWGAAGDRHRKKYLLSAIYLARSVVMTGFFVLPFSESSVYVFSALMGLLWLATVPLTSGLVAQMFGTQYMATLVGIVFFSHQVGSFLGIWLGGRLYDATGTYDAIWWIGVALGLVAALLHWPIDDRPVERVLARGVAR